MEDKLPLTDLDEIEELMRAAGGIYPRGRIEVKYNHAASEQHLAKKAKPRAMQFVRNFIWNVMGQDIRPADRIQCGGIKDIVRMLQKAETDYDGDVSACKDVGRLTLYFNDASEFLAIRKFFEGDYQNNELYKKIETDDVKIIKFKDQFRTPKDHGHVGGYITLSIRVEKGASEEEDIWVNYEVLLSHVNMKNTNKITHEIYKEIRRIEAEAALHNRLMTVEEQDLIWDYQLAGLRLNRTDLKNYKLLDLLDDPEIYNKMIIELFYKTMTPEMKEIMKEKLNANAPPTPPSTTHMHKLEVA